MPIAHTATSTSQVATARVNEGRAGFLRLLCPILALILGGVAAWAARSTMYPDGISYLDIGDAYWRGDWHNAINAYWSPLYSWILGAFLKVFKPSIQGEFPLVHLVNFLIYIVALASFAFFLETFIRQQEEIKSDTAEDMEIGLPVWAWYVFGYSAFITASLFLITVSFVSGDMAVSAIVYFATALVLRIQGRNASTRTFVLLGLALGVGYYAKTAMLLMAFAFLIVVVGAHLRRGTSLKPVALAFFVFLLIAAPFMVSLSVSKGRPTFGDSGTINYTVNVERVRFFVPNAPGILHPVRRIPGAIEAYEYALPIAGTYPLWFDPTYWHQGIRPVFDLRAQIRTFAFSAAWCAWILFSAFMGLHLSTAVLFLYLLSPRPSRSFARAASNWMVWVPALAGIVLYFSVVIRSRYVGASFGILWIVGLAGVRLTNSASSRRIIAATAVAVAIATSAVAASGISRDLRGTYFAKEDVATPECPKVAAALLANGVHPGGKIAVVSDWLFPSREGAYIARLARLQIIGEARPEDFWAADETTRAQLVAAFADARATVLLTNRLPRAGAGWQRLAGTDYYLYRISAKRIFAPEEKPQ